MHRLTYNLLLVLIGVSGPKMPAILHHPWKPRKVVQCGPVGGRPWSFYAPEGCACIVPTAWTTETTAHKVL